MQNLRSQTDGSRPLVSVAITAYNSERTLPQTLESVLDQQTGFPVEIVLGVDLSTDDTLRVALGYQARYPAVVRVIAHVERATIMPNYYGVYSACRGKYVAVVDSDDYWTDPEKLAIQAGILESDPTIALVGHCVRWVQADGEVARERVPALAAGRYGMAALLESNFLPSPSVMYSSTVHRELPLWYFDIAPMTDWPLYILAAKRGDVLLLDRNMADYRLSASGAFWGKGESFWYEQDARFLGLIDGILPQEFRALARTARGKRFERLAYYLRQQGDFTASRKAAVQAVLIPAPFANFTSKWKMLLAAGVYEALGRKPGASSRQARPKDDTR